MKVYVATTGSYSDYRIAGVFTRADLAQQATELLNDSNEIEEYEVDALFLPERPLGMLLYEVMMWRDGDCIVQKTSDLDVSVGCPERVDAESRNHTFWVWARDKKHAVKIVGEYRMRLIAEGKWPE